MTATDYIPLDTTLRGKPRLEPRSRNGVVLDRRARGELPDRRGGQGDEGRFLREAAATALGNAALGAAAGAAAPLFRDAARTAVNLSGAGPRVILPVGPDGMRGTRRAGLSTPELEATRARLPGETTDMWFANPRLSAAGRAATRTNDSAVDRLAARFAERRNGALSAGDMLAEPEAMSAAYPRGMAETTVRTGRTPRRADDADRKAIHETNYAAGYDRAYQQDSKGGDINDGRHGNFRNFLATDDIPETIFGIPVVQDESGYTEKDVAFFRENPKAAGFYEMGDEGDGEG